jgi:hypothetical protein
MQARCTSARRRVQPTRIRGSPGLPWDHQSTLAAQSPNYLHCIQTFPCGPAEPPLSSPFTYLSPALSSPVQSRQVLSSLLVCTFASSRTEHGPWQTSSPRSSSRCLANVTETCLSTHHLPFTSFPDFLIDSSPHRHTGHQSPTFAFASRVLFCFGLFCFVQHAV